jgi:uncharacterized protein
MKIIDIHTHAFKDSLARKALDALTEHSGPYKPCTDGTVSGLLGSMDIAGIETSIIANIATKKEQFSPILNWSKTVRSSRIIPLGSIHPLSDDPENEIRSVKSAGLPGIKLHPLYQDFTVDDRSMYPLYEIISSSGLFLLMHAGYDIAFPGDRKASSDKIARVIKDFPDLIFVAAHFGAWSDWDGVLQHLAGKNIWFDTSFLEEVPERTMKDIFKKHDIDRIVFGSDSPWLDQGKQIDNIMKLDLKDGEKEKIFSGNIMDILKAVDYESV